MDNSICKECYNKESCTAIEADVFRDDVTHCVIDCRFYRRVPLINNKLTYNVNVDTMMLDF